MRDHCAIPQEMQLHLLCCFSHLTKLHLPPFITIVWPFEESLIPFLPQFHSAGEAHETIISHSALLFMWNGGFVQKRDRATTFVVPCSLFPGLGVQLQLFWKKHFGELHYWWPVFLLWVFNQYLWGFGGKRTVALWLDLHLYRSVLFSRFPGSFTAFQCRGQHRHVTQVSCVDPD